MRISRIVAMVFVIVMCAGVAFAKGKQESGMPKIGVVVKVGGIPWFNAMEVGIKKRAQELGMDGFMIGPTSNDPALQVRAIEDLIAQKVDVIGVVPNDANAVEPVLKKARDMGIKVIMHESPNQKNSDWNFDLISNAKHGQSHAKLLAERMGGEGKYIVYVGGLTVPLHNAWADLAIEYLEDNYPAMTLAADRFGVAESVDDSYQTALDMMRKYPDLKGVLAFGSQGPIGAARAVIDAKRVGTTVVIGSFSPGQGEKYVKGELNMAGYMWNPMLAGEVFVTLGKMLLEGKEITDGMDIEGMGKISVNAETHTILGDKIQPINRETVDELAALGL